MVSKRDNPRRPGPLGLRTACPLLLDETMSEAEVDTVHGYDLVLEMGLSERGIPTNSDLNGENKENPLEDGVPIFRHTQMVSPW